MEHKEDWQKVGGILEKLCKTGLFPGIGYDVNGWEAWVFLAGPVEGMAGDSIKVYADTATKATESLLRDILSSGLLEGTCRDSLLNSNSHAG